LYDIRFSDNKYLTNNNSAVIKLQGVTYPIALNLSNSDADYTFTDAVTGKVLGTINAGKSGVIVINELPFNAIKVNKTEVSNPLDATFGIYPNPTKDFSTISFSLTENSFVTVELFDAIGNKVNTVVEGNFVAGNFTQSVDLTNYSTGNYIAKITAGKFSSVVKFSVVK